MQCTFSHRCRFTLWIGHPLLFRDMVVLNQRLFDGLIRGRLEFRYPKYWCQWNCEPTAVKHHSTGHVIYFVFVTKPRHFAADFVVSWTEMSKVVQICRWDLQQLTDSLTRLCVSVGGLFVSCLETKFPGMCRSRGSRTSKLCDHGQKWLGPFGRPCCWQFDSQLSRKMQHLCGYQPLLMIPNRSE